MVKEEPERWGGDWLNWIKRKRIRVRPTKRELKRRAKTDYSEHA